MFKINRHSKFQTINVPRNIILIFLFYLFCSSTDAQSISGFTLINADSNTEIANLAEGESIILADLATDQLNIKANTSGAIGSVTFFLNGAKTRTENVAPYAMFGDNNGNYYAWTAQLQTYEVRAEAYSQKNGKGTLLDSRVLTFSFVENSDPEPETAPVAPSGLAASSSAPNAVDLQWSDNSNNETGFVVEYRTSSSSSWEVIASLPANTENYTDNTADNEGYKYYRVKSTNAIGDSPYSSEIEVTNFPSPPTNLAFSDVTQTSATLSWTEAPFGNDYLIESSSSPGGPWAFFDALYYGYTDFRYSNLKPNTTYYFRMRTNFQSSSSEWSPVFSLTTLANEVEPEVGPQITSFILVNADTDQDIAVIAEGDTFNLFEIGSSKLNIRAEVNGGEESVVFGYNGNANFSLENLPVYAIGGNSGNDYKPWVPDLGANSVTVTAYTENQASGEAGPSSTVNFTVIDQEDPAEEETSPAAPSSLVGSSTEPGILELSWTDNSDNEQFFVLEHRSDENAPWVILSMIPENTTNYTDNTVGTNPYRNYRLKSFNNVGSSAYTVAIEVTNFPSPPSAFIASSVTQSSFSVSWGAAPFGEIYEVQRSLTPNSGWVNEGTINYGETSASYAALLQNTNYYYRMRTLFQGRASSWNSYSVTTLAEEVEPQDGPSITRLVLVNADTDQDIKEIIEGDTFNLFSIGSSNLNIRAEVGPGTESVIFGYNGNANYAVENFAVYAIGGDSGNDYKPWTPDLGSNTVTATAYTENQASGEAGPPLMVNFQVIDEDPVGPIDPVDPSDPGVDLGISGELRKWHKVTLTLEGPELTERGGENPFKDYRLDVTFTNGSTTYIVPGYYAADGNAANTGANSGKIWRAHFAPDKTGEWTYFVSFRKGSNVAIASNPNSGTAASFDGASGTFTINNTNKTGRDFRGQGRLSYVGKHYLQFQESGRYFIKAGADAPENTFAYDDFDATPNKGNRRKSWQPHAADYSASDAGAYTWGQQTGSDRADGKEMLGMIRYLSDQGMNVFSFLTFSLNGDDGNVFPHASKFSGADDWSEVEHTRFDVSKMDQWEKVMEYADKKGIFLHFKSQETENDQRMDGGQLGTERKLYYRELIARYGHHLALNWNLGEENDIWQELNDPSGSIIKSYAQYIKDVDPYDHHIVIHTYPGQQDEVYDELTGNQSVLTGPSVQSGINNIHNDVRRWVNDSRNAGKKWVVANDEQGGANIGVGVDASYPDSQLPDNRQEVDNRTDVRHKVLWGTLMAGGSGVEYYYGYRTGSSDLSCQDHRTRATKWSDARHALAFFNDHLQPHLTEMRSNDGLTSSNSDYVLAKENEVYALYLPSGGSTNINLGNSNDEYTIKWYNPRSGGGLVNGSVQTIAAAQNANIGTPPNSSNSDWVALLINASSNSGGAFQAATRSVTQGFSVFPNPTSGVVSITLDTDDQRAKYSLQVINVNGQVMTHKTITGSENRVDLSSLSPGNYFLIVKGETEIYQQKLILIK